MKLLFTLFIFSINTFNIFSQDLFVKRQITRELISLDFFENAALNNSIYRYESDHKSLSHVKVSSNEDMIAFIESPESENYIYRINNLKIINRSGQIIHVEDSILDYDWSPDGNKIILTKGLNRIEGYSHPEQLMLIDFNDNISRKYFDLKHYLPIHLNWVGDHVYFRSNDVKSSFNVIKFNVRENEFIETELPSTDISPDELYATVSKYESIEYLNCDSNKEDGLNCFKIYDIAKDTYKNFFSNDSLGVPYDWVYSSEHHFIFKRTDEFGKKVNDVYNVANGENIKSYEPRFNFILNQDLYERVYFFEK